MTKKEFVIAQIKPYWDDPTLCGVEEGADGLRCKYITKEGKMCVVGKNMLYPYAGHGFGIGDILLSHSQKEVFKPDAVGILYISGWIKLQRAHDSLALGKKEEALKFLEMLGVYESDFSPVS